MLEMHWVWINSWRLRVGLSRYCHSIFQCTESETTLYKSHCFITSFLSFHIFYAVTFCSSVLVNTTVSKSFAWWSGVLFKINAFKSNNWMPVLPCYWSLVTWHVLLYKTWWLLLLSVLHEWMVYAVPKILIIGSSTLNMIFYLTSLLLFPLLFFSCSGFSSYWSSWNARCWSKFWWFWWWWRRWLG